MDNQFDISPVIFPKTFSKICQACALKLKYCLGPVNVTPNRWMKNMYQMDIAMWCYFQVDGWMRWNLQSMRDKEHLSVLDIWSRRHSDIWRTCPSFGAGTESANMKPCVWEWFRSFQSRLTHSAQGDGWPPRLISQDVFWLSLLGLGRVHYSPSDDHLSKWQPRCGAALATGSLFGGRQARPRS